MSVLVIHDGKGSIGRFNCPSSSVPPNAGVLTIFSSSSTDQTSRFSISVLGSFKSCPSSPSFREIAIALKRSGPVSVFLISSFCRISNAWVYTSYALEGFFEFSRAYPKATAIPVILRYGWESKDSSGRVCIVFQALQAIACEKASLWFFEHTCVNIFHLSPGPLRTWHGLQLLSHLGLLVATSSMFCTR